MALSRVVRIGDGVTNQFVIDFALGYVQESDVTCRVDNEVDGGLNPVYRNITFLSETLVQIDGTVPANGAQVVFDRTVEKETLAVNFTNGDVMDEINLDVQAKQLMMSVHEVLDGKFGAFLNDLDMATFRITNLGDPVDPTDGTNKQYVDAVIPTNEGLLAQTEAARDTAVSSAVSASSSASAASTDAASALASKNAAAASAANAATSASTASSAATTATTQANTATTKASEAAASAASASTDAGTATTKASEASASASAASTSETNAAASEAAAGTSETNAAASELAAGNSETNAAASETAAAGSAALAHDWAQEAEDVEVTAGEYSAYHWAQKAQELSQGTASNISFTPYGELEATDVQGALQEVIDEKYTMLSGVSFGSVVAADETDLSKHIDMWGGTFGFNITSGTLNIYAGTNDVYAYCSDFYVSGTLRALGHVTSNNHVYLGRGNVGDNWIIFRDTNSNTDRYLGWDDSANALVAEENDGGFHHVGMFSTSTSNAETNYPLGTDLLVAQQGLYNRNASSSIYLHTSGAHSFQTANYDTGSRGAQLSGTWRSSGTMGTHSIFRRVA